MNDPTTAKLHDQLLELLRQLQQEYDKIATSVQQYHDQLMRTDPDATVIESPASFIQQTMELESQLRQAYQAWRDRTHTKSPELKAAVDSAALRLQHLLTSVNSVSEIAQTKMRALAPSMTATSTHQRMTQTYARTGRQAP